MKYRRTRVSLCLILTAALSAGAVAAPLQVRLRIVEACTLETAGTDPACAPPQRSDAPDTPAPPQVQALTPPVEDEDGPARPWRTITF